MSPRRNRPRGGEKPNEYAGEPGDRYGGFQRTELWQGEEWSVRHVAGASAAGKRYRCPGCDQEIPSAVPHVVAWSQYGGVDDRRHWHKACWNAKDRRTSRVQRPRSAPRY
ncbi:ATP/GTP-binding protein [Streptomyces ficellus]|uniref:ATP/GTP-binding protein n=1 Tax=Streptomyces ficellus TaxID=1977088 RepID=A0ABT7Z4Q7_9ACTN|nr:ATP/GTP-binding protein [Streptomyces ficellus]MDN3294465.1 ATP/GTP-binding protein [Streptomyces ficellus]